MLENTESTQRQYALRDRAVALGWPLERIHVHRLIELCSLAGALILDEDGIYDPANFNDRHLHSLKGTMSEAELHFLKARMRGGLLNKARRGELRIRTPSSR